MDDHQFRRLLDALGYSFAGYRRVRKGVKKRIRRHMLALGCREVEAYSLAMADRESRPTGATGGAPLAIIATDLNPRVLARARAGPYPAGSLRGLAPAAATPVCLYRKQVTP